MRTFTSFRFQANFKKTDEAFICVGRFYKSSLPLSSFFQIFSHSFIFSLICFHSFLFSSISSFLSHSPFSSPLLLLSTFQFTSFSSLPCDALFVAFFKLLFFVVVVFCGCFFLLLFFFLLVCVFSLFVDFLTVFSSFLLLSNNCYRFLYFFFF